MRDEELLRYSRQIMLPEVDIDGQDKLRHAHVLIVGVGGLGSPAAMYLAAAGVGQLTLVDNDEVELSNLQRQIAHTTESVGTNKAVSAKARLSTLNPHTQVNVETQRLDETNIAAILTGVSLVLDCTDNFDSRYLINDLCWRAGIPVVSGAAIRWEGQISLFDPSDKTSPCYRCLYPSDDLSAGSSEALNCAENGVIAPLVGVIGTCQALEAVKYIMGVGDSLVGHVLYLDAKYMQWRKLKLNRLAHCPVCAQRGDIDRVECW